MLIENDRFDGLFSKIKKKALSKMLPFKPFPGGAIKKAILFPGFKHHPFKPFPVGHVTDTIKKALSAGAGVSSPWALRRRPRAWRRLVAPHLLPTNLPPHLRGVDGLEGLDGLGKFLKKIHKGVTKITLAPLKKVAPKVAAKIQRLDDKFIDKVDAIHTKIHNKVKKHWKTIVIVVAAVAITVYSMGAGATIAAKMLSGLKALGAAAGKAAMAVKGAVVGGGGGGAGAGKMLASGMKYASLASQAAQKLVAGKRCDELSTEEREAYGEAAKDGFLPINEELQKGLGLKFQGEDGREVAPSEFEVVPAVAAAQPAAVLPVSMESAAAAAATPSGLPSWVLPAAIAGGAVLLLMMMNRGK